MSLFDKIFHRSEIDKVYDEYIQNLSNSKNVEEMEFYSIKPRFYYRKDAEERCSKETDPKRKELMEHYIKLGYYNFDAIFGKSK